ncbi:hypothetical protein MMYC01_209541 [Madurella mycetomatis]|uniref:Uncharacterized protein n=1 Tax=Madurella mycetomatis TaxID=100816 RepID=A0A175VSM0_9PEZI|nr:hypothetical protein MMYC01_209541 [Madurella mycetomatis]
MSDQLRPLLSPGLFHLLVDTAIPYSTKEPIDFALAGRNFFWGEKLSDKVIEQVRPFLLTLSKLGLENVPDLTTFLPPPSDPDFPRQALGLQLLLDQMPRRLCKGIHTRWTNAYFDVISLRYAQALDALPGDQKPHSWARWRDSVTLDYWIHVRTWFSVPFVHTDQVAAQERAVTFTDETRRQVEELTGTSDPHREQRSTILSDIYAFPRVVKEGAPQDGTNVHVFTYWMCMLMDVHKPIVDRFGRYPYRNAFFGREDTPEEEEWFEKTGNFARPSQEVRDRLKKDTDAGVWTPLTIERDSEAP